MALTRARVIHGPAGLVERLTDIVRSTLCRPRDPLALVRDVADMRDRIARHAPPKSPWDFKHLPGGLFDIDFVAQYLALRHAAERPDLLDPHPAEMLRRAAEAGFIDRTDAERLRAARTLLSDVQGLLRLTLNGDEAAFDEANAPEGQRRLIAVTEGAEDLAELRARIATETAAARAIYRRIVEQPARDAGWQPRTDDRRSDA
jgi:glutamate-ammonia-ligase adenylyltransferase